MKFWTLILVESIGATILLALGADGMCYAALGAVACAWMPGSVPSTKRKYA